MKPALIALLVTVTAAGAYCACASSAGTGQLLGGYVLVVAYPNGQLRICPDYAIAVDGKAAPPSLCQDGLPVVGVQVDALSNQSTNPAEEWGNLYLVGRYDNGTFQVSSQSNQTPTTSPSGDPFGKPPCRHPDGGWALLSPRTSQENAIRAYKRRYPRDITSVAFFDGGHIATVASTHPQRTRTMLGKVWPKQLCVVRSRYSLARIWRTRKLLIKLLLPPSDAARYGWISGAGGISCDRNGQPVTPLELLIVTPALEAFLLRQPRGLVAVDTTLSPVPAGQA
jgi:hypothetical protein